MLDISGRSCARIARHRHYAIRTILCRPIHNIDWSRQFGRTLAWDISADPYLHFLRRHLRRSDNKAVRRNVDVGKQGVRRGASNAFFSLLPTVPSAGEQRPQVVDFQANIVRHGLHRGAERADFAKDEFPNSLVARILFAGSPIFNQPTCLAPFSPLEITSSSTSFGKASRIPSDAARAPDSRSPVPSQDLSTNSTTTTTGGTDQPSKSPR